jgi:hypothetical protein
VRGPEDSIAPSLLPGAFEVDAPDRKRLADFTHIRTTAGGPDLNLAARNGALGPAAGRDSKTDVFDAMEHLQTPRRRRCGIVYCSPVELERPVAAASARNPSGNSRAAREVRIEESTSRAWPELFEGDVDVRSCDEMHVDGAHGHRERAQQGKLASG